MIYSLHLFVLLSPDWTCYIIADSSINGNNANLVLLQATNRLETKMSSKGYIDYKCSLALSNCEILHNIEMSYIKLIN